MLRDVIRRSPLATRFAVRALGLMQKLRDRNLSPNGRWKRRAGDETRYWAESLLAEDAKEVFAERLDPEAPITGSLLGRALDELSGEDVSILDVGSGPLTSVGKTYPGRRVTVVAVDPLADDYARVLSDSSLEAPVPAIACGGGAR